MSEPDYMITYREFWAHIVELEGSLNFDQIARELHDYREMMCEVSKVYEELAGLSKPNTAAVHILDGAERRYAEIYADFACDQAQACTDQGKHEAAEVLRAVAEEWREGSWQAHQESREHIARIMAQPAPSAGES